VWREEPGQFRCSQVQKTGKNFKKGADFVGTLDLKLTKPWERTGRNLSINPGVAKGVKRFVPVQGSIRRFGLRF